MRLCTPINLIDNLIQLFTAVSNHMQYRAKVFSFQLLDTVDFKRMRRHKGTMLQ